MEIGYEYNDVFSQILICYISVANGQLGPGIRKLVPMCRDWYSNSLLIRITRTMGRF